VTAAASRPAAAAALHHLHALQVYSPEKNPLKNDKTELLATLKKKNLC
jgi:hypothetical protein